MKLYRLLTGDDSSEFCHKVTEALSKGWELTARQRLPPPAVDVVATIVGLV